MHMEIGLILAHRYPQADPTADYEVMLDTNTNEPVIRTWNAAKLGPQPTAAQLESWWLPAEKANKKQQIGSLADTDYKKIFSVDEEFRELDCDDIMQKKLKRDIGNVAEILPASASTAASDVDALKQKRNRAYQQVNDVAQGSGETVAQAVTRVRAVAW